MLTQEALAQHQFHRFEWNNGAILEYWKGIADVNDFEIRIGVRFFRSKKEDEFEVWIFLLSSMYHCKHVQTIEQVNELYTLLSGRKP